MIYMEKNNEKEFKQTRLIIVLVAIIIVLIFAIGLLVGQRLNDIPSKENPNRIVNEDDNKDKTEEKKEEEPEEDKYETIPTNSSYLDDVPGIPRYLCGGVMFNFNKKDVYLKDLSDNDKLNLLLTAYESEITVVGNPDYKPLILDDEDIKKYFEDTSFLDDIKKNGLDSGKANNSYQIAEPIFIEFKNNKLYVSEYATGCEGPGNDGYDVILVNAKKNSKELIMTYKVYYKKNIFDEKTDNFTNEIYINKNDSKPKYRDVDYDEFAELDYTDFDSYTMHFDITNNNIRFEKMIYNEDN